MNEWETMRVEQLAENAHCECGKYAIQIHVEGSNLVSVCAACHKRKEYKERKRQ